MNIRTFLCAAFLSSFFLLQGTSVLVAQDIVINKIFNGGMNIADSVELLVIKDKLNLQGMVIRDFTPSLADAGSGAFRFQNIPLWQSVSSGTLIILNSSNTPLFQTAFTINVGLSNKSFFITSDTLTDFDLASQDMVMLKSADASVRGTTSSIHALAYGLAGSVSVRDIPKKLWIPLTRTGAMIDVTPSGNAVYVYATSPSVSIQDFNGTGTNFLALWDRSIGNKFGQGNTPNNQRFIDSLRRRSGTTGVQFSPVFIFTSLYPNPATEMVNVRVMSEDIAFEQNATMYCYSTLGNLVNTAVLTNTASMMDKNVQEFSYSCVNLPQGAYFLELRQQNGSVLARRSFLKMR